MTQKIVTMLTMQNEMNSKVHPQWIQQNFEWDRAIWIECAELMEHHGWKWWKKQTPDVEQIKLELVDIWHFGLSLLLQEKPHSENLASEISNHMIFEDKPKDFLSSVEIFASNTLKNKTFSVPLFTKMLMGMEMDMDHLYKSYIGKNVLNFFRQDHGYKDGSYIKEWGGVEDNEHLVEISEQLDADSPSFKEELYQKLKQRYQQLNF